MSHCNGARKVKFGHSRPNPEDRINRKPDEGINKLLSFMLVGLAVRYLIHSLPNLIPCVLDILEVLVEDTDQPSFLPWEFDTIVKP